MLKGKFSKKRIITTTGGVLGTIAGLGAALAIDHFVEDEVLKENLGMACASVLSGGIVHSILGRDKRSAKEKLHDEAEGVERMSPSASKAAQNADNTIEGEIV